MLQLNSKLAAFEVYLCAQCSAGSLICVWLPSFENFCNNPTWWHKRVIGVSDSGLMTSAEHSFFTPRIDRSRQDWIRLATIHDLVIIWSLWMMMVWTTASTVLCLQFYSADVQWECMDTTAEKFEICQWVQMTVAVFWTHTLSFFSCYFHDDPRGHMGKYGAAFSI